MKVNRALRIGSRINNSENGQILFTELDKCTVSTVSLAGITVKELESVKWENNRGGSGTAKGTINWRVPQVVLQPGENIITICAKDKNTGELYKTEVKVTYVPVELLGDLSVKPDIFNVGNSSKSPKSTTSKIPLSWSYKLGPRKIR